MSSSKNICVRARTLFWLIMSRTRAMYESICSPFSCGTVGMASHSISSGSSGSSEIFVHLHCKNLNPDGNGGRRVSAVFLHMSVRSVRGSSGSESSCTHPPQLSVTNPGGNGDSLFRAGLLRTNSIRSVKGSGTSMLSRSVSWIHRPSIPSGRLCRRESALSRTNNM